MVDGDYFGGGCRIMHVVHKKLTVNAMEVIDGQKGINGERTEWEIKGAGSLRYVSKTLKWAGTGAN